MNPEIQKMWTDALRSGEYSQGERRLRLVNDTYCCIGVLADLYHKNTGNGSWKLDNTNDAFCFLDGNNKEDNVVGEKVWIPRTVAKWSGMDREDRMIGDLIRMNDTYKNSFVEIADFIDEQCVEVSNEA